MNRRAWAVVAAWVLLACEKAVVLAPEPLEVEVVEVKPQDLPIFTEFVGVLDGMVNAEIRARVPGYIESVDYREGSMVKVGDPLFRIDPVLTQASLKQAEGQVETYVALLNKANIDVARNKVLIADGVVTQKDYDQSIAAQAAASAQLTAAKGALESAKANVGYTKVKSPINGVAGLAKVRIGNLVGQGEPTLLTTVSQLDPIRVTFTISEQLYLQKGAQLRAIQESGRKMADGQLQLILADGSIYPHAGVLGSIDRQVDQTTGTITIQAYFPNTDLLLRPGQYGKVRARTAWKKDAIAVPQRAIRELQGVYQLGVVAEGNKVEVRAVTVGERVGRLWIIDKGVAAGEKVIVEGLMKTKPNDVVKVKMINNDPAPVPPTALGAN